MKRFFNISKLAVLLLLMPASCMQEKPVPCVVEEEHAGLLSIGSLSVEDFAGDASTRAVNDGVTVTFENGDELGVLLIDEEGNAVENVLFRNENGTWRNTAGRYYSSGISSALAYYPYIEFQEGQLPSTVEELKDAVSGQTPADAEFSDRDLLVAELTDISSPELTIRLGHAYSLIVLSGEKLLKVGEETFSYMITLSNVALSIGDRLYEAEEVGGRYLVLLDGGELRPQEFRYFYTADGTSYVKTVKAAKTLEPNHSYSFPCVTEGGGDAAGIAAGDFYCTSADGMVVIIPRIAASIPVGLTCKGIVFYVMDADAFGTYASLNGLTVADYNGYNGNHGLMVSLKNGGKLGTGSVLDKLKTIEGFDDLESMNGYKLTHELTALSEDSFTFDALANHSEKASENSTSWFAPSYKELSILVRGGDGTVISGSGWSVVGNSMDKVVGAEEYTDGRMLSVTQNNSSLCFLTLADGTDFNYNAIPDETIRPICAF